jgi:hypothetical protein
MIDNNGDGNISPSKHHAAARIGYLLWTSFYFIFRILFILIRNTFAFLFNSGIITGSKLGRINYSWESPGSTDKKDTGSRSRSIGTVIQHGPGIIIVYDENGEMISQLYGDNLKGYTSNTVSIESGNMTTIYDAYGHVRSSKPSGNKTNITINRG